MMTENICPICHNSRQEMTIECCKECGSMLLGNDIEMSPTLMSNPNPFYSKKILDDCTKAVSRSIMHYTKWCNSQKRKEKLEYYQNLSSWLDSIEELDNINIESPLPVDKDEAPKTIRFATYISFLINVCLLMAKSIAISSSISYTIISSLVDSCLDLVAGVIISLTAANSKFTAEDLKKYPIGKSRIPVVGILVFSILMACCAFYIAIQCVMSLIEREPSPPTTHTAIHVMWWIIITKFIMAIIYYLLDHPITNTLADDHRNDVLTNSFGLFMYWGGAHFYWWMDSTGGIILSAFVIYSWVDTAIENSKMLMGLAAPDELTRKITFVAANHHPLISSVEKVTTFQVGPKYMAEVHIVLPDNLPLYITHEIGETLQLKIERIEDIERCWVHVDCTQHESQEHVLDIRTEGVTKIRKQPKPPGFNTI